MYKNTTSNPTPPRVPARWLRSALPQDTSGQSTLGDLYEEYLVRADRSAWRADLWYWFVATRLAVEYRTRMPTSLRRPSTTKNRMRHIVETFVHEVRFAARRLVQRPGFALTAVAIIGLGIGANTAIFSIVNSVLFRPLPYDDPDTLVRVFTNGRNSDDASAVSYQDFLSYEKRTDLFRSAAVSETTILSLGNEAGAQAVFGEVLSSDFFSVMGLKPTLGRAFRHEEETGGAQPVVMISYQAWDRVYGKDPNVLGKDVQLNNRSVAIVGVGPRGFTGTFVGVATDYWLPFGTSLMIEPSRARSVEERSSRSLFMYARLQDGVSIEQATQGLNVLARSLAAEFPMSNRDRHSVTVMPANDVRLHPMIDALLFPVAGLLMAVVGIVLLVACTNLANLLLVQASSRSKEVAVRIALGSPRWRVVTQMLAESTMLGIAGGIVGLLLAIIASRAIVSFQPPIPVPIAIDLSIDQSVLMFTLILSMLTGVLFGLAPALRGSRPTLIPILKDETQSLRLGGKRFGLRNVLVVSQIALSVLLLVGAGLFLRSLRNAHDIDPGFRTTQIAIASLDVARGPYTTEGAGKTFYERYLQQVEALPGVTSAVMTERLTLGIGLQTTNVHTPEMIFATGENSPEIDFTVVTSGFFEALDIPILRGRSFDQRDDEHAPLVAIVSETMARRFWQTDDVTGRKILLSTNTDAPQIEVVGVVRDIKVRTLGEAPRPFLYLPFEQNYTSMMTVLARTTTDPASLVSSLRTTLATLDPNVPLLEAKTITDHFAVTLFAPRMGAALISIFGVAAMLLAGIGLYGVIAVSVAQRTREVGIRVALGACESNVVRMVMRQGFGLVVVGLGIGLGVAALVGRTLSGFLIGVKPHDALTYISVATVLGGVAVLATYLPARRAARVDPVTALRYE